MGFLAKGGGAILCLIFEEEVFWIFLQNGEILDSFAEGGSSIFLQRGEILDTFVRGGTIDISFEEGGILGVFSSEEGGFSIFLRGG